MAGRKELSGLRLACDGCHVRKLRCTRNSSICARCLRDGVRCVYSPARKVGRPSRTEQMASRVLSKNLSVNTAEVLESLHESHAGYTAAQQPDQEASHAVFWAQLSSAGYAHLPFEGFWNDDHDSGEEPNNVDAVDQYGNMTMTIGSESFPNDNLTVDQSPNILPTYNDISTTFEPKLNRRASGIAMEPISLVTPPRERSDADTEAPTTAISNKVQRFAELQQEMFDHRSRLPDYTVEGGFGKMIDIDAVISTGQAILELTRSLFPASANSRSRTKQDMLHRGNGECDPAKMLVAISPSLLVVTTYNDVLNLISATLNEIEGSNLSQSIHAPSMDSFSKTHLDEAVAELPSQQPSRNTLLHGLTTRVGNLDLDFPLRLIISMSIIEYQLGPLERSLHFIDSNHSQGQVTDISWGILAGSVGGLQSAIEEILSKVRKLIQQAKLLDTV